MGNRSRAEPDRMMASYRIRKTGHTDLAGIVVVLRMRADTSLEEGSSNGLLGQAPEAESSPLRGDYHIEAGEDLENIQQLVRGIGLE